MSPRESEAAFWARYDSAQRAGLCICAHLHGQGGWGGTVTPGTVPADVAKGLRHDDFCPERNSGRPPVYYRGHGRKAIP